METNKIINADCLEFMATLPDKCIDLIIADPPYNIKKAEWDDIPDYINWLGKRFLECQRILKDNPCQKPMNILQRLIKTSSNPNDIILDPFTGSGSALVAAERLGRYWIGVELSKEYCAIAKQRIFNEGNGRLFDPYEMENK